MRKSNVGVTGKISFLLTFPVAVIMLVVVLFPVFDTIRLSFFDATFIKPGLSAPFIGFENYRELLQEKLFWRSLWITLKWTFSSIIFQFSLGFGLALLINRKFFGKSLVRSLLLIPWMLPGSLAALMWKWVYHGSIGLLNYVLLKLGIIKNVIPWLADSGTVLSSAVVVNVWRGSPFFMVMLLGGLQTIPKDLYEAAEIDGANPFQSFINVTIPFLKPLIMTLLIYGTIGAFNFLDIIMVLTRGGPANHTLVLPLYAWMSAFFENRIGFAATICVLICIVLSLFGLLFFKLRLGKKS